MASTVDKTDNCCAGLAGHLDWFICRLYLSNILVSILLGTRFNWLLLDQFSNHSSGVPYFFVHWICFRENPFDKHTFVSFLLRFFSFSKHNLPKILMSYILKLFEWVRCANRFYTDSCGRVGDFTRSRISDLLLKNKHQINQSTVCKGYST